MSWTLTHRFLNAAGRPASGWVYFDLSTSPTLTDTGTFVSTADRVRLDRQGSFTISGLPSEPDLFLIVYPRIASGDPTALGPVVVPTQPDGSTLNLGDLITDWPSTPVFVPWELWGPVLDRLDTIEAGGGGGGGVGDDPNAVKLTGDQTITGVKTFTAAPVVPDSAFTIGKTSGLQAALNGKAPTARTITAGTGLTGGGDLTANRTLAVSYGTTAGTAAQGNDTRLSDARTPTAHAATHASGGVDALAISGAQVTSGTLAVAQIGTGTPAAGKYVDGGTGAWTDLPSGGGGGTGDVPPGTPIVRFANPDMTWPTDLPTPTAAQPLILYADISSDPDMLAYPAPPLHTRNSFMRYHGPEPVEQMPTVTVASSNVSGRTVTFTATPNPTPETTISGFAWAFAQSGTSTGQTGTGQSITMTAPNAGDYTATVIVTDSNNMTATASHTVTLSEGQVAVTARGTVDGMTVSWEATGTDHENEAITYSWTGTDSLTGTGATLSKTYATSGTKSATVTATDSKGTTATATATVSVSAPVTGAFTSDTFTTASTDVLNRDT